MQIKQASMKLAQTYMKRVTKELELARNSDRESTQEALLLQGVHFAYRAHQVTLLSHSFTSIVVLFYFLHLLVWVASGAYLFSSLHAFKKSPEPLILLSSA